ncbi:hypothetical protein GT347_25495 [Xylophilus rhododendri]|uniref:Uncharacterized protein n=2 Tax=Xylophilus rhododendri TaxID=2697032 RepID=A0A857JEU3_9BURK|nr:hypothetical protein GT347_25495 [Xylophilus rhododendri]
MDWVPVIFIVFKVLVLGTGMFFAVKWHYEQGKKEGGKERRSTVVRAGAKAVAVFAVLLLLLLILTFGVSRLLGLNLTAP